MANRKNPGTLWRIERDATIGLKEYKHSLTRTVSEYWPRKKIGELSLEGSTGYELRSAAPSDLLQAANNHYHAHEDEYMDLAVMQAHLEGVALNLEQPLVIGNRFDETNSVNQQGRI